MADDAQNPQETPEAFGEQIKRTFNTFKEASAKIQCVVVCSLCGSTMLDQNDVGRLSCYNCGNELIWNAYRFSILRNKHYDTDFRSAIENVHLSVKPDERFYQMETALSEVLRALIYSRLPLLHNETPQGRLAEIQKVWEVNKEIVDQLLVSGVSKDG